MIGSMNHGTQVTVLAEPNGDLRISNPDGSILIRQDGTVSISTLAPIELTGATLGRFDQNTSKDTIADVLSMLQVRGKKR